MVVSEGRLAVVVCEFPALRARLTFPSAGEVLSRVGGDSEGRGRLSTSRAALELYARSCKALRRDLSLSAQLPAGE